MAIYLPRRRTSQPQFPARIDRANSLTDKIEFLHTSASLLDLTCNGYDLDKHVNVVNLPHNGESAWVTSATTGEDLTFKKGISIAVGEDFTMLVRVKVLPQGAEDSTGGCMVLRDGTSATPIIGIYVGANGVTTSANRVLCLVRDGSSNRADSGTTPPLINDGKTHTIGLKRYSNSVYWSVDGSAWVSFGSAPTQAFTFSNPSAMNYGNDAKNTAIGNLNAAFSLGALWRRSLSNLEIQRLHRNPWQLLKLGQTLYVGVASVGGPTLVTASDSLTPSFTEALALLSTSSVSDTFAPGLTETPAIFSASDLSDTVIPGVSESVGLAVLVEASDTLTPSVTETANVIAAVITSDTLTPTLVEAQASFVTSALSEAFTLAKAVTESLTLSLTEVASIVTASLWTDKAVAVTVWTDKAVAVTVWTDKPDASTTWTVQ